MSQTEDFDVSKLGELSREQLVKIAIEKGASANQLARQPTYAIVQLLEEQHEREKKKAQKYVRSVSQSSKARRASKKPMTYVERQELKAVQELENPHAPNDFDDTETVVDMSHVVNTNNPTDQKYHRFIFLAKAKSDLVNSIKNNSALLKAAQDAMEQDDIQAFMHNVQASQQKLKLVTGEMKKIHQWFNEVYQEKKKVYQQLMKEAVDLDGTLEEHFRTKMDNIKNYIQSMAEQTHI